MVAFVVLGLVALELSAWLVIWLFGRVSTWVIPDPSGFLAEQSRMLDHTLNHADERRDRLDPLLGWIYVPGYVSETDRVTAQGLRADREYDALPPTGTRRIAVFGDSFTYGIDATNEDNWPARLEQQWRAEALNFGVGGYGADQAVLRFERDGVQYAPHVAILAITTMMAPRMVSRYRRFQDPRDGAWFKPRFIARDGELHLVPTPVGTREEAAALLAHPEGVIACGVDDPWYMPAVLESRLYRWSRLYRLAYYTTVRLGRRSRPQLRVLDGEELNPESEPFALLVRVAARFAATARAAGADAAVLLMPARRDVERQRTNGSPSYGTLRRALEGGGIPVIDAAPALAAGTEPVERLFTGSGHASPEGNAIIAAEVARALDLVPRSAPDVSPGRNMRTEIAASGPGL